VQEGNYLFVDQHIKPIQGEGRYYGKYHIKLDKHVPSDSDIDTLYRYARAFYFPPHEPAYLMSGSNKMYLTPNWIESVSLKIED
jgi:hypothetical protein